MSAGSIAMPEVVSFGSTSVDSTPEPAPTPLQHNPEPVAGEHGVQPYGEGAYAGHPDDVASGIVHGGDTEPLAAGTQGVIFVGTVPHIEIGLNTTKAEVQEMVISMNDMLREKFENFLVKHAIGGVTDATRVVESALAFEHHPTGTDRMWHFHYAIRVSKRFAMTKLRFKDLQENFLIPLFKKWSYFKIGHNWNGILTYYTKNVAPKGDGDAYFAAWPVQLTSIDVHKAAESRQMHKRNDHTGKNRLILSAYENDEIREKLIDTGVVAVDRLPQALAGARAVMQHTRIDERLRRLIKNTEVYWIWGASRTGKTHCAMEHFCWEIPGNRSSKHCRILRCGAVELQGGFLNGYEGHEVVVIDEIPKNWAEAYATLKRLQTWMDCYEGTINVKGGFVPKRVWRWVLVSNYSPTLVLCSQDSGSGQWAKAGQIDLDGTYLPLAYRATNNRMNPERTMMVTNQPGENGGNGHPTMVKTWDWWTRGCSEGEEERPLERVE